MKRTRDGDDGVAAAAALDPTTTTEDVPQDTCGAGSAGAAPLTSPVKKRQRVVASGLHNTAGVGFLAEEEAEEQPQMELENSKEHEHEQRQQQECRNLLTELPSVALRRLLDFLSFHAPSSSDASPAGNVPELLRVRAESEQLASRDVYDEEVPLGEEEAFELKFKAEGKRLRALLPYHAPTTSQGQLQQEQWHDCWSSIGALRLTCRDIKSAVDHALGGVNSSLLVAATALYAPLDRFLAEHAFPSGSDNPALPLLAETPAAARTKAWFRKMADVTLGAAQARLHQARLGEVLDYVWRAWEYAPAKLSAFRQQLLSPCSQSQRAGEVNQQQQPPLLKVEYLQREDDYLGSSYAIGVNSCISLGLPDMPHERVEIWLNVLQAWDHRDEGWDLQVLVSLHTTSDAWRERLLSSSTTPDSDGDGDGDGDDNVEDADDDDDDDDGDGEKDGSDGGDAEAGDETKAECIKKGRPLRLVLLDYYRSRGEIVEPPSVRFGTLCKVWQCMGLAAGSADGEADGEDEGENQQWNGTEVLTTVLACLGFAWKDDVELMWEDCDEDNDVEQVAASLRRGGRGRGQGAAAAAAVGGVTLFDEHSINDELFSANRHKGKVLSEWRQQVEQLSGLLEANSTSAPNEASRIKTLELAVRRIRRFIAQQRLSRAVSHIAQRAQGAGPWASRPACPELARLDGYQMAKELRVIYARAMDLCPGEYSNLSDDTVELGWRVPADALLRVKDDLIASPSSAADSTPHQQQLVGGVELVIGVSTKSDNCYTGTHEQEMVTVRVIGHHPQLRATLEHLAASAQIEEKRSDDEMYGDDEDDDGQGDKKHGSKEGGVVVLQLKRVISDMGMSKMVMATEAIEFVGRLLGLSLRAGTDTAGQAPAPGAQEHHGFGVPDLQTTPLAQSVLAFVREVAQATMWDADEGTFPVHLTLRQRWASGQDDGEEDNPIVDDSDDNVGGSAEDQTGEVERLSRKRAESSFVCRCNAHTRASFVVTTHWRG